MRIDVKIDASALEVKTEREAKRLAYATAQAINDTALAVQTEERVNLDQKFRIRKAGFMYRLIKIFAFANPRQGRPYAEVGIDNDKSRVLLSEFEQGGEKLPEIGANVAIPLTGEAARPDFGDLVAPELTFQKLGMRQENASRIWQGKRGTYLIPGIGVFQRVGKITNLIYAFKRNVHLKAMLGFVERAQQTFAREFQKAFDKRYRS